MRLCGVSVHVTVFPATQCKCSEMATILVRCGVSDQKAGTESRSHHRLKIQKRTCVSLQGAVVNK